MARVLTLGPLALPTLLGDLKEAVGDQLEAVGAGVVPGERRPRPFPLTIPIHGDHADGASRFIVGNRMRRQVRALMENSRARLEGLYLAFTPDSELNGWMLIGGGELAYGQAGVSLADYKLELSDCYRVASWRTHRAARRIVSLDRRLSTTPRDILGTLYSTEFSSYNANQRFYFPPGVTDPTIGATRLPVVLTALATADGSLSYTTFLVNDDIVDYEQGESDMHRAGVEIHDRQGAGAVEASWEQIYGPDQPLTAADVPVMENALVRVLWDAANVRWDVQAWSGSAWVTDATVVPIAGLLNLKASVLEWTPERGVIVLSATVGTPTTSRVQIFVTLQRGWTGPRFECYTYSTTGAGTATLSIYAKSTGNSTFQKSTGGAVAITTGGALGTFTGLEPWGLLLGPGTDLGVHIAVLQQAITLTGATLSSREGVTFASTSGYVSMWLGIGPRATAAGDAANHGLYGLTDARQVPELVART